MPLCLNFKKYLLIFLLANIFLAHGAAYAQTDTSVYDYKNKAGVSKQIQDYLCAPTEAPADKGSTPIIGASTAASKNAASGDLYNCINRLYKFSLILASCLAILFIVIAGYVYMSAEGNQEAVDKAKSILTTSLTALVILFGGYVLLRAINPDLIQFKSIQPPSVSLQPAAVPGAAVGGGGLPSGAGTCQAATTPYASINFLQSTCFGSNANLASQIANKETGGNPTLGSSVDKCRDQNGNIVKVNGNDVAASWGLFQINITAHNIGSLNCPSAFSAMYTATNHICLVTNPTLYTQCVAAAIDANTNIRTACQLSNNGQNWKAWANECGF